MELPSPRIIDLSAARGANAESASMVGFDKAVLSAVELAKMEIVPRRSLVGNWFREGDLGFIYGKRGLGKTWLSWGLARSLSEGHNFGPWAVEESRVLYVDGEMPLEAIKQRDAGLTTQETDNLLLVNHEAFFDATEKPLSLSDPKQQQWLLSYCERRRVRVLFLDNLSCLFSGMRENDADDWEQVLPWLLSFRRKRISVVIVHHTGRAGTHMRGTSRREDAAFWTIGLSDSIKGREERREGARFLTRFTKDRNSVNGDETGPLEWHFASEGSGKVQVKVQPADNPTIVLQLIEDGLDSCSAIAEEMGLSKGAVSKISKKLQNAGKITITSAGKYRANGRKPEGNQKP